MEHINSSSSPGPASPPLPLEATASAPSVARGAIAVLHVDTERGWRGGQQQAAYLIQGLRARGVPCPLACRAGSALEERAGAAGWPCHAIPMRGELDLLAGRRIAHLARREGCRILHLHSGHALALGLWARLFSPRLRLVASRRVDFHIRGHLLSRFKYRTRLLDRIVCISAAVREVLLADGVPPRKLTVIHSGVDLGRFGAVTPPPGFRRALGIPEGHVVAGTVAALVDHKDYPTLLRAAARAVAGEPRLTFVAVGDGPLRTQLEELARELRLGRRFVFAGYREDVGNFLKSFDLFVLASKLEGLGTSVLDAQAVGLPVVACRSGGIGEMVRDGENGLLVPSGDPEALAGAILELVRSPGLREALGSRGRVTVEEFAVGRMVERHLALYRELLP